MPASSSSGLRGHKHDKHPGCPCCSAVLSVACCCCCRQAVSTRGLATAQAALQPRQVWAEIPMASHGRSPPSCCRCSRPQQCPCMASPGAAAASAAGGLQSSGGATVGSCLQVTLVVWAAAAGAAAAAGRCYLCTRHLSGLLGSCYKGGCALIRVGVRVAPRVKGHTCSCDV